MKRMLIIMAFASTAVAAPAVGFYRALSVQKDERESPQELAERLQVVVRAIRRAAPEDAELRWMLLTTAQHESHFALRIHEGKCRPGECDGGRARSLWQLHRNARMKPGEWESLAGTSQEATDLGARLAAGLLRGARASCGDAEGALSLYARGGGCKWSGARQRVEWMRRMQESHSFPMDL